MNRFGKLARVMVLSLLLVAASAQLAFAEGAAEAGNKFSTMTAMAVAAGLAIGIAALGGALAQGRAIDSALTGIARNPGASGKILVPMILGLALIESLVIYALIIAFSLVPKL
jgi:F-type H+-transporting ATPase subunit c